MMVEHINAVQSLLDHIASGNFEDKLQKETLRLQEELRANEIEIDRKKLLIRKIDPTMAEGLLTKREADELHARYEADQGALEQKQSGIREQIRQIEDGTLLECNWAEHFKPYFGQISFSRKDVAMLIEAIFLHKDKHIEICFVHDLEFQYIRQVLE